MAGETKSGGEVGGGGGGYALRADRTIRYVLQTIRGTEVASTAARVLVMLG